MADSFLLDGLQLNDLTTFGVQVDGFSFPPPREKQEWVGAADSEAQVLFRAPKHENRTVTIPLTIMQQASVDLVFDKIGQVVDKLTEASQTSGGIELTWSAHGSSRTATVDVLAGEIPELTPDWQTGFQALSPELTLVLTCKPYIRLTPIANVTDAFGSNTIGDYTFDTGSSATTAVSGGQLVPSATGQRIMAHTASPYQFGPAQVTAKFTTGTTLTNGVWGVMTSRFAVSNWLVARIEAGTNVLRLVKNIGGTGTLSSTAFTPAANTSYWVRIRKEGNLVTGEVWTSAPTVTGTPAASTSTTLAGGDATALGAGVVGYSGLYWTVADTAERADDLSIEPNVFRSSTPGVSGVVYAVPGDVAATADLVVTDTAAQARRLVEWGLEGPATLNTSTELIVDSDGMITSGFAGTGSTQSGAYDPGAAGNSVIALSMLGPQAMCGFTGTHSGTFRVKGRFYCNTGDPAATKIRLLWKDQDNPQTGNAYVRPTVGIGWNRLDLGTITVSGNWSGYIEASSPYYTETLKLDYLELIPVSAGYGKARATYAYQPGVTVGRDEFTTTTAGNNLNARVAPAGGTWATSGSATDFQFADDLSGEQIKRSTISDASARFAILGSTNYTDTQVETSFYRAVNPSITETVTLGSIARWTDSSNYLRAVASVQGGHGGGAWFSLIERVAGTDTTLAVTEISPSLTFATWDVCRLIAYASGRAIAVLLNEASSAVIATLDVNSTNLATGGTLATGKPGIYDMCTSSSALSRYYDNFAVATPAAEPIAIYSGRTLTVGTDSTERQNSAGTASGNPPSYHPAGRFTLPVGNSRVHVAARRTDTDTTLDGNVTDSTQIQVAPIVPRALVVPRS